MTESDLEKFANFLQVEPNAEFRNLGLKISLRLRRAEAERDHLHDIVFKSNTFEHYTRGHLDGRTYERERIIEIIKEHCDARLWLSKITGERIIKEIQTEALEK